MLIKSKVEREVIIVNFNGIELKPVYSDYIPGLESPEFAAPSRENCYIRRGAGYRLEKEQLGGESVFSLIVVYRDNCVSQGAVSYHATGEIGANLGSNPVDTGAEITAGYTLCNTGRTRHTVFVISNPSCLHGQPMETDITITGIPEIISVELVPGRCEAAIELAKSERPAPQECKPSFELKKHMQLVCSADISPISFEPLDVTLELMKDTCPYIRALGFNGVESYVRWNTIEYEKGKYDWSYYDGIINFAAQYGLKWFPLVIGGSAYALPEWYHDMADFQGFKCLEHGIANNVPTIFNDHQSPYIIDYLHEFGRHYNNNPDVFGCRLGPSGNYGESQYPASGNCGYKGQVEHMHLGWWAADKDAAPRFRAWLQNKYGSIDALNKAWHEEHKTFIEIETFHPVTCQVKRKRKDFVDWYMFEMSCWCEKWAVWMREEMPDKDIYQSSGGWGFGECGTDFTDQTRSMMKVNGGIRATNEDESYELNFAITRMLSSSARFYHVPFGSEPAGFSTARGVMARLYNIIINNGQHLFYYRGNLQCCDISAEKWLKYAPLLEKRAKPVIEVAVMYPDTLVNTDDSAIRYLDGSAFFSQVYSLRRHLDFDFCSERMVLDGALEQYKAFVFLSRNHDGDFTEQAVLDKLDTWLRGGGTIIYPVIKSNARAGVANVEGDYSIFNKWQAGDTGKGEVVFVNTLREPLDGWISDLVSELLKLENLNPLTKKMMTVKSPAGVYSSILENGYFALYNDSDYPAAVEIEGKEPVTMEPLSISLV